MTHNYDCCEKSLSDCKWCRAKAEKLCKENGIDTQELDCTLHFHEQGILQQLKENQDDPALLPPFPLITRQVWAWLVCQINEEEIFLELANNFEEAVTYQENIWKC